MSTQSTGRVPPHSAEAEEQMLSACLLDGGDAVARCVESKVTPDKLYVPANRVIFERLVQMHDAGKEVAMHTLAEELKTTRQLDHIGGYPYLTRISGRIPTTAGLGYFIEKVMELATLRECIRACTQGVEDAYAYSGGIDEYTGGLEQTIFAVTGARVNDNARHVAAGAKGALANLRKIAQNGGKSSGVSTGLKDIDSITFGLQPCEMSVLAGRPSCGKTALALNIAEAAAMPRHGKPAGVLIFSLEMSSPQLIERFLFARARVNGKRINLGMVKPNAPEFAELEQAESEFSRSPIYIDDSSDITISQIRAKARRVHGRHKLGLIIIDYLQLIKPRSTREPREQQVAEISKATKAMAKELGLPVLMLAQLNRASEKENRKPRLSDLRESGSVEQDADVVLLLSRPKSEGDDFQTAAPTMNLDVAKNRNGEVGDCLLTFVPQITRFENHTQ
jgi:replicative DNA helicase